MSPVAKRVSILITELMVFFLVTALASYFIAYASALQFSEGDAPPAQFPVIAYDGDRARPDPRNYFVVPWSQWEATAARRPGASLLLPERSATIRMGDADEASFTAAGESESRQAVELVWRSEGREHFARYAAQAQSIEPRYLRTFGTQAFLMGVVAGFVAGLLAGRVMRRRWLAQPGYYAPASDQNKN